MNKSDVEELERLRKAEQRKKERIKRQNEKAKESYDRISFALPKGYKDKIKALTGKALNAYLVELVTKDIARIESEKKDENSPNWLPFS